MVDFSVLQQPAFDVVLVSVGSQDTHQRARQFVEAFNRAGWAVQSNVGRSQSPSNSMLNGEGQGRITGVTIRPATPEDIGIAEAVCAVIGEGATVGIPNDAAPPAMQIVIGDEA